MDDDERFFWDHAGWGYDPETETSEGGRIRNAKKLASAEKWLRLFPHQIQWDETLTYRDYPKWNCWVQIMRDNRWEGTSLDEIDLGPTGFEHPEYMRVVVAELALELMET